MPQRVEHWKRTGEKPGPVMVGAADRRFLDFVKEDRPYSLCHTFIPDRLPGGFPLGWPGVTVPGRWPAG
jgi:hypothetical protein